MPRVVVPPPYRGATHGLAEVSVPGDTIAECLSDVISRYHDLGELVLALDGSLQPFVTVFLNGEKLSREKALDVKLTQKDVIEIISAIAGGN
jgi:sulfur carrier protein ThiS